MMMSKLFFNWSSGKDSAFALYKLLQEDKCKIDLLFTSVSEEYRRVSMHGLHEDLLRRQAESIGIPIEIMYLPESTDMEIYNALMQTKMNKLKERGYGVACFGDIFLEDLKQYRESELKKVGFTAKFPLWEKDTKLLLEEFLELGFRTIVVAANAKWFDQDFVGTEITKEFIDKLPEEVDPCGENGEFHTFCFDGPIFEEAVLFKIGEKTLKTYPNPLKEKEEVKFWYCDLLLK